MSITRDRSPGASPTADDAGPLPLGVHDVSAISAARIRRRALMTLEREAQLEARSGSGKVALWYRLVLEPALLIGLGLGYCAWATVGALAVLH